MWHVSSRSGVATLRTAIHLLLTNLLVVDRYLLLAERSAANPPHAAAAVDREDRQTDGRTFDRFVDAAPHTMRAVLEGGVLTGNLPVL